jgi:hypothetical protein
MQVLHVNLHHSREASAAVCATMKNCDVALIQEPWNYKGVMRGLKEVGGELIYSRPAQNPRSCILMKKGFPDSAVDASLFWGSQGSKDQNV